MGCRGTTVLPDRCTGESNIVPTLRRHWSVAPSWSGRANEPGGALLLDFDGYGGTAPSGSDDLAIFLMDGQMGVYYSGELINAGLEEGVYTNAPNPRTPDVPPPQAGQIAFSRDGKIYRANTDGTGLVQLSAGPADDYPAWPPDGHTIAFASGSAIEWVSADGSQRGRIIADGTNPAWQP
jgi:WD40-like Beta Propeller Repeat.